MAPPTSRATTQRVGDDRVHGGQRSVDSAAEFNALSPCRGPTASPTSLPVSNTIISRER
jgi:hypothetical protein